MTYKSITKEENTIARKDSKRAFTDVMTEIHQVSDRAMNYVLACYFLLSVFLAPFHDTYVLSICVGGLSIATYLTIKWLKPEGRLHHYVLSGIFAVFPSLFIYQIQGLFDMHFTFLIGSTLLITYRYWNIMLPLAILTIVFHILFAEHHFNELATENGLVTYLWHIAQVLVIYAICGYWAENLGKDTKTITSQKASLAIQKEIEMHNVDFAQAISSGNLEVKHKYSFNDEDKLGQSLIKMQDNLLKGRERDLSEKFINEGIAEITEIIRQFNDNPDELAHEFVSKVVKYTGCNQGGLFLLEDEKD
ncbi:hypothetical protein JMN32_14895, partial [Fulvivirga sp. 29W222]|nr:hypothetical protein [Fulvivirga marina]